MFQFQYGTIKRFGQRAVQFAEESFNSNMVRLKEFGANDKAQYLSVSIPIWYD